MNTDDFEKRLKRQPFRQVPANWRVEILASCRGSKVEGREQERFRPSTLVTRLSAILWPHPKAWAGLAAVWVLIFCMHYSMRDTAPVVAEKAAPLSPEAIAELRVQHLMLAELIGVDPAGDVEPPEFLPQPRSRRVDVLMT